MDTKKDSAISDVPTFKVARVGHDRKRKGAGFSFLRGGGTRGAWSGATGGAGAGGAAGGLAGGVNVMGMTFSKALLAIFLTAGLGSAAIYVGGRSASGGDAVAKKPSIFSDKGDIKLEGDTSNLPSNSNSIPNSLGYLSGSMDGLTPEERAKKAAEAAAAAEAQRLADEEAAKKAEADNLAGKPAVDPAALLASAQADGGKGGGGSAFGKKFGSLSSSFGGGSSLTGGAGLSGGVNRQFGSSGSLGKAAPGGQLSASRAAARPTYSKAGKSKLAASNAKGFARKQLANASGLSRRGATATKGETAAYDAASAFDNNQGAGNVISGPGIGKGSSPNGGTDSSVNPGGGGTSGGPTGTTPTDCASGLYLSADGVCTPIKTSAGQSANKTLDMLCMIAQGLLMVIAIIALIKAIVDKSFVASAYGPVLGGIMAALGGIIAGLGIAIIAMGDYFQGTVFTLTGGFIAGVALIPGASDILTSGTMVLASAAGMLFSQAAKMLGPKKGTNAPAAAQ